MLAGTRSEMPAPTGQCRPHRWKNPCGTDSAGRAAGRWTSATLNRKGLTTDPRGTPAGTGCGELSA